MLFDVIPVLLIFLAVVVIVAVVLRRLPDIATLKVETIPEAQSAAAKRQLLVQRLGRKMTAAATRAWENTAGTRRAIKTSTRRQYERLLDWERRTKVVEPPANEGDRSVAKLLSDADRAREDGRDDAEAMYLEVIRLDHRNAKAYFGLGLLYWAREQHEEARQALEYAGRIDKENPQVFAALAKLDIDDGKIAEASDAFAEACALDDGNVEYRIGLGDAALLLKDYPRAIEAFEAAVALEPSNPRCLDRLLEACILVGNKRVASATLRRLTEVNPENNKLIEFQQRVAALPSRPRSK